MTSNENIFGTSQGCAQTQGLKSCDATSQRLPNGGERLPLRQSGEVWVFGLSPDTPRASARQVSDLLDDML